MERLDKFLCDCGIGTRSQVKAILKAGRVTVDGKWEKDGAKKVDPKVQRICLDGQPLAALGQVVVMLHKPAGFVTATEDAKERTVMELLPPSMKHWDLKPIGRLDKETEGLLLFTNDGDLLHRLITPSKGVKKVYIACHEGVAAQEDVAAFKEGITLKDGTLCRSAELEILEPGKCRVTVEEGKYHQVRRMLASRGLPVTYLKRVEEGGLSLGELPLGEVRQLTEEEIQEILNGNN